MSDQAFASITPVNALARLAFSDVYETLTARRQNEQAESTHAALRRMQVEPKPLFDDEIVRLRREMDRAKYDSNGEASESLTEADTDTEERLHELGQVWTGSYLLSLDFQPKVLELGWTAGKGPLETMPIDLLLCTRTFAKRSSLAQLTVNGSSAARQRYHLNQYSMKIQISKFEYCFQWKAFAAEERFKEDRTEYVSSFLGGLQGTYADFQMPTPVAARRTMGKWTLGDALGAGGQGRVFFASDASGNVAAVKVVERTNRNHHGVNKEIQTLQEVTKLACDSDDGERVVRMIEVIYSSDETFSSTTAFDNVAIVLQPLTPKTFVDLMASRSMGGPKGMTIEAATAFRDSLLAVKVLHDGRWVHRDLKPANIGLIGRPVRAVLLDVGTSRQIEVNGFLPSEPGKCGTIGYLAPELELQDYDQSVDIWAMGIILFQLTYSYHPWRFSINPWREGKENEQLRPSFRECYNRAVSQMATDYNRSRTSPTGGYIHLGGLFVEMVAYQWPLETNNRAQRLNIDQVLEHPAWGPLLEPASPQAKRPRVDFQEVP